MFSSVKSLLDKPFTIIFSHTVTCFLLMVSFSPTCSFFILYHLPWGMCPEKNCSCLSLRDFLPMFCYRSCMVSAFTFNIHLDLILCAWVKQWSGFILLHGAVQFFNTIDWETVFSPSYIIASFITLICLICMGLILGSLLCSIDLWVCSCASIILFRLL